VCSSWASPLWPRVHRREDPTRRPRVGRQPRETVGDLHETNLLRERINSGLREARRKGVKLGRPKGTTLDRKVFLQKHKDVLRQLKARQSVRNAAKITGKGVSTVQRVKLALAARVVTLRRLVHS
jgi:hypothetical protein